MLLIAVIVGYVLGIAPFVVPKIIELRKNKINKETNPKDEKTQNEILDEWLNGAKESENKVNQQDIYNEYLTGETTEKGD
ncbi:MAG: hypothetical protein ACI4UU_00555 [Clostridia bacterium]